jgi:hypothetical protein
MQAGCGGSFAWDDLKCFVVLGWMLISLLFGKDRSKREGNGAERIGVVGA